MPADERIRRALLFMPGDDQHKIDKGAGLAVDAVIMDLEDAVALTHKQAARDTIRETLATRDFGQTERLVRVNPASTGLLEDDLTATIEGQPDGYVLPKVESALDVRRVSQWLLDAEHRLGIEPKSIHLLAIIETPPGVVNLKEIAAADGRLVALIFGAEDLAGSMGAIRTPSGHEAAYARGAVVVHAAAYGLQAIDTPYTDFRDAEGLRADTRHALEMGYTGKLCIHPAQIDPIVDTFTPTDEEIARAQGLIAAHEQHQANGTGVFAYQGQMIDRPMIRAAERVLARAEAAGKL